MIKNDKKSTKKTKVKKTTKKEEVKPVKKRATKTVKAEPVKKTRAKKVEKVVEEPKKRAPRKPKVTRSESDVSKTLATSCCSTLKKSMSSNDFKDWEEVGFGESAKQWYQIRGLMNGNNIAISKEGDGRKKKYTLFLVSKQGTEVECEFDTFSYKMLNNTLTINFSMGDKTIITHKVTYGENDVEVG